MIKGTSRQILEITDTKNAYFERALLVVRPDRTDCPAPQLQKEAHKLLNSDAGYSGLRRERLKHTLTRVGLLLLRGGIGALSTLLLHI
jgi:hypothetical protein